MNIFHNIFIIFFITDDVIIIIPLPDWLTQ